MAGLAPGSSMACAFVLTDEVALLARQWVLTPGSIEPSWWRLPRGSKVARAAPAPDGPTAEP